MAVLSILSRKALYLLLLYYLKIKRRQKYKKMGAIAVTPSPPFL